MTHEMPRMDEFLGDLKVALHRRRARAHRRRLVAMPLLAACAAASVALGATNGDWWASAPPADPVVLAEGNLDPLASPPGLRPILADARTVARIPGAALIAAPTESGGTCLIFSRDGHAHNGSSCDSLGSDNLFTTVVGGDFWMAYGRITDAGATAIGFALPGLPASIPLQHGGFFLFEVPQAAWSSLDKSMNDVSILGASGSSLRTGCMRWGTSPKTVSVYDMVNGFYDDRSSCADLPAPPTNPFEPLGNQAPVPAISGTDILTGKPVDVGATDGHPGFLVVWQSYCRPCVSGLTDAQTFADDHPDVAVVGLDVQDLPAPAVKMLQAINVGLPSVAADDDLYHQLVTTFGVAGYPSVLAFDARGRVVAVASGDVLPAGFEAELTKLG